MRFRKRVLENSLTAYVWGVSLVVSFNSVPLCFAISTYISIPELVDGAVDSAIGPSAYLFQDGILIKNMLRGAVGIVVHILGSGIESLLAEAERLISMHCVATNGQRDKTEGSERTLTTRC